MNFYVIVMVASTLIAVAKCTTCPPPTPFCTNKTDADSQCPFGAVRDICGNCWTCGKGFKEACGGVGAVGVCADGLFCTNDFIQDTSDINNNMAGICCRVVSMTGSPLMPPVCSTTVVQNPCTGVYECRKALGEVCGGHGNIKGVCEYGLGCYPPFSDTTRNINSICIPSNLIPPTTALPG